MIEALKFVPDHEPNRDTEPTAEIVSLHNKQLVDTLINQYREDETGINGKSMSEEEIIAHRAYLHTLADDPNPETRIAVNQFLKEVENNN